MSLMMILRLCLDLTPPVFAASMLDVVLSFESRNVSLNVLNVRASPSDVAFGTLQIIFRIK